MDVAVDRQGRIFVPSTLRSLARIEKEVVIVGLDHHIEIWSKATWQQYSGQPGRALEDVAQQLDNLGV